MSSNSVVAKTASTVVRMEREIGPDLLDRFGDLRASQLLMLMDSCACLSAEKHSKCTSVTLSMDDVNFTKVSPKVGQVLIFQAQVNRAFKTSMEVGLRVEVEDLFKGKSKRLCGSYFVFVALNAEGKKVTVPPLEPEGEKNIMRFEMALERREIRFTRNSIVGKVQSNITNQQHLRYSLSRWRRARGNSTSNDMEGGSTGTPEALNPLSTNTTSKSKSGKKVKGEAHQHKAIVKSKNFPGTDDAAASRPVSSQEDLPRSELVLPVHANHMGNTFGGQIMAWCHDQATVTAMRHCRGGVHTVSVDDVYFLQASTVGDRIDVYSSVNRIFNQSLEVGVRVEATKSSGETLLITKAYFTLVVIDAKKHIPSLEIQTEADKRRYQRALGRRRIRLERLALRGQGRSVAWPFNAEDIRTLVHYNIRSLLKAAANGDHEWGLLSDESGVQVWSKTNMVTGVSLKSKTIINLSAQKVFHAVKSVDHRLAWDPMVTALEIREVLEEGSDIAWMVANNADVPLLPSSPNGSRRSLTTRKLSNSSSPRTSRRMSGPKLVVDETIHSPAISPTTRVEKDFVFLRTWRTNKERTNYILASHSIQHPSVPKMTEYARGEVASSGFIVKRMSPTSCEVTYVVQLGTSTVNMAIDELVGGAKLATGRMLTLKRYCANTTIKIPGESNNKATTTPQKQGLLSVPGVLRKKAPTSNNATSGGTPEPEALSPTALGTGSGEVEEEIEPTIEQLEARLRATSRSVLSRAAGSNSKSNSRMSFKNLLPKSRSRRSSSAHSG